MYHGYGFTYMIVGQILFFAFTVGLVIWIVRSSGKSDPISTLKGRLAKGEITKKEFDDIKKKIDKN